jgi:hypothetical protein
MAAATIASAASALSERPSSMRPTSHPFPVSPTAARQVPLSQATPPAQSSDVAHRSMHVPFLWHLNGEQSCVEPVTGSVTTVFPSHVALGATHRKVF